MSRSITVRRLCTVRNMIAPVGLRRLQYFVAVAEECHFGRAAARLHMSTPPLSQRIRELEAELGLQLFERTSRRVELTTAGGRLLSEARMVLAAADRFGQVAAQLAAATEDLGLGFCHGSEGGAMQALRRFHEQQPDIVVRPGATTSLNIYEGLRMGRLSVGIVRGAVPDADRLMSIPIARVPVDHVALPPSHRLAALESVSVHDLDGEPVLVVDRNDAPHAHDDIAAYCATHNVHPRWINHGATQIERVLDMVAVGSGIGWMNTWQVERYSVSRSDIAIRPLTPIELHDEFRVAWRVGDTNPATAVCVRVILETCGSQITS
jgi:DNA-binding transcriptional LysR family regulator